MTSFRATVPHATFEQRRLLLAFLAALLLHFLLFGGMVLYSLSTPAIKTANRREESKPVRLVITPAPAPPARQRARQDAPDSPESLQKPARPLFESDRNSIAASENPAAGSTEMPDQKGRTLPFTQLETKQFTPGKTRPEPPTPPVRETVKQPPVARSTPAPTPVPTPIAQPSAKPQVKPGELALLTPPREKTLPTPALSVAPATQPQPEVRRAEPAYQPQREKTRIEGSISNRGRSSVDAIATPMGRYRRILRDAIESRWQHYVEARMDLMSVGETLIKFDVTQKGSIENVRIVRNTANEAFATCSLQSVMDAELPPIPPDVAASLDGERLEVEFNFNLYSR